MKKNAKRTIALFLSIMMVVSLLTLGASASNWGGGSDEAGGMPEWLAEMLNPTIPEIREGVKHVACIGDSVTWGTGVMMPDLDRESTYPVLLEAELGENYQVLNYGFSGKTLLKEGDQPYTESKFYDISHEADADVYVIMLGTNDSKPYNWNAELYREELEKFVRSYMELPNEPQIYLMTPPRAFIVDGAEEEGFNVKNDTIRDEAAPIVREVAELLGVNLIDMYKETEGHPEWFPDGVHPNAAGNAEFAKIIAGHLKAGEGIASFFSDIANSPYVEAIEALAKLGLVNGTGGGKYSPDATITRSMAVTILGHLAKVTPKDTDRFSDVVNGTWYSGYVGWAEENGIVEGVGGGLFQPDRAITGEEMGLMLSRYAKVAGIAYTAGNTSKEPLTRGEMAEMVYAVYQMASTRRETTNGPVQGRIESTGALAWLGVPYGAAERWKAPTDPAPWDDVRECITSGPMAIQFATSWGPNGSTTSLKGSADCLNLDVYAPAGAENLPVLVFLHGGNNQTGDTSELRGQELVITNDCVFVTLNFRTGALGFNPLPALKTGEDELLDSGNYTLLDIAFALDWVKENVAEFGGNPDNITISGHSAGGRDVMALLISPLFKGKFDKAFVSSGGMTTADEEMSAAQFANALAPLAVEAGKADTEEDAAAWLLTDGEDVLEFLTDISNEQMAGLFPNASIHMALFPHLYNDGTVLPKDGFATTEYNSIPIMMLTGINEFSMFSSFGFTVSAEYRALDAETQVAVKAFADKYGSDMYRIFNGQESANTMFGNYDAPIYVCQVDYGGSQSGHGVFKSFMDSTQVNPLCIVDVTTPDGKQVSALYNAYLTNFLHTGDPNGDGLNKWTSWDPETQLSMVFDGDGTTGTAEMKDVSKTYQDIIDEMEADTTISDEIKAEIINTVLNGRWFSEAQDDYFGAPSLWVVDQ